MPGKQLGSYSVSQNYTGSVGFAVWTKRTYFGGKLIGEMMAGQMSGLMQPVVQDRLGSVGRYYPYGEERNTPPLANDQVKFATYTRDSATGNDYADQRYYSSVLGRFMTPDPYVASANGATNPADPQSWNRYAYGGGDPANHKDPTGQDWCEPGDLFCDDFAPDLGDSIYGLNFDFSALAAQIAAQIQQALSGPEWPVSSQLIPLYFQGYVTDWGFTNGTLTDISVNWDNVFGLVAIPWPTTGTLTWEQILGAISKVPVVAVLAGFLVQTGGPPNFPKHRCPDQAHFSDPTKSPGKDWEWRGNGPAGSSQGSWYNPITHESLHPDLNHPGPIKPHWDYTDPTGQEWRCFGDGTYQKK